jgi:Iron-containing redox enzyme
MDVGPLRSSLQLALADPTRLPALSQQAPMDRRDAVTSLLTLYSLHTAPLDEVGDAARLQHDPTLAAIKARLERDFIAPFEIIERSRAPSTNAVDEMRALAHADLVPPVYDWIAERASLPDIVEFLTVEGGPDAGFDDLVALCQIGISGLPKVALATNYWDEMGRGDPRAVHTTMHDRLVDALGIARRAFDELPLAALERNALNGYLTLNRVRQPEAVGALGLLECQAGPRSRRVVTGLLRTNAPAAAIPFYEEHAHADPRHGKDWLQRVVAPLVARHPAWGPRIVRGARWRAQANRRLFDALETSLTATAA